MNAWINVAALCLVASMTGATVAQDPTKPEESTVSAVIAAVKSVMGDATALAAEGPFRFDVVIGVGDRVTARRTITWSPSEDRVRVDLETKAGKVCCAMALGSDTFAVESGGKKLDGAEAAKVHAQLRKTVAGDLNYLLLPQRLSDTTLEIEYRGAVVVAGKTLDRIEVRYPEKHTLAGDSYFLVVDRETGVPTSLLVRWSTMKKEQAPLRFDYAEWRTMGMTKVSKTLQGVGHSQRIEFEPFATKVKLDDVPWLGL